MRYYYRCKKTHQGIVCDTRVTLPRPVEDYINKPKCPSCKALLSYRDTWQQAKNRENVCKCDGYHFPHRQGCKFCNHNPHMTEQDREERRLQ